MTIFNIAQTFRIDASAVANSPVVSVSGIGMFFMYRPDPAFNRSTQIDPGITIHFTDVVNDLPNLTNTAIFATEARVEWNEVLTSSDASVETVFTFNNPITVPTNKTYAFIVSYDNDEDYLPWTNIKGNPLVGTTNISTGPSSNFGGKYYQGVSIDSIDDVVTHNEIVNWTALDNATLKFNVYAARYAVNNDPIFISANTLPPDQIVYASQLFWQFNSNNSTIDVLQPSPRVEMITFNESTSLMQAYIGGQRVYQQVPYWPGGNVTSTVSVNKSNTITASGTLSNGAAFSWNNVFGGYAGDKFVTLQSNGIVDIRKVVSIVSNTQILVDEPTTFVNTASQFMIAPVANIDSFNVSYITGKRQNIMFLRDSSANSTVRFKSWSLLPNTLSITNAGTSYNNGDIILFTGYENAAGATLGRASLITNSSGSVTNVFFIDTGSRFSNTANISIVVANSTSSNTTSNTSLGNNLAISVNVSSIIFTEQTNNIFKDCVVRDIDLSDILTLPNANTALPNVSVNTFISFEYYSVVNAASATGYTSFVNPTRMVFPYIYQKRTPVNTQNNLPTVVSRSHEFVITYANGSSNDRANNLVNYSNNFLVTIETFSNNDFIAMGPVQGPTVEFGRYIINNDYTLENTNQGNALARHIMTTIPLVGLQSQFPEDIRIFLTAYRPLQTDFQVYARIQNQADSESFDDEDWTRLQLIDGDIHSQDGYVEMTWGFQSCPNTQFTVNGYVTTTNNSSNITGTNTTFTSNLAQFDLIKLYDPLFANDNFAVLMVNSITNNTLLTVDAIITTNVVIGIGGSELAGVAGLKIDRIDPRFKNQAFTNPQNSGVVRYYNDNMHVYDTYDTIQVKVILLSPDLHFIPRIHNIRGVSLSS